MPTGSEPNPGAQTPQTTVPPHFAQIAQLPQPFGVSSETLEHALEAVSALRVDSVTTEEGEVAAPRHFNRPVVRCPNCGELNREVQYSCNYSGNEWGSAYFDSDGEITDHDRNDNETSDYHDYIYTCAHCDHQFDEQYIREHVEEGQPNPEPTLRGRAGVLMWRASNREYTAAEREAIELQKPDGDASHMVGVDADLHLENLLKYGCECPKCHKLIQVEAPERNRNSSTVVMTHQACPECGHEFKLSDILGNNHASRY